MKEPGRTLVKERRGQLQELRSSGASARAVTISTFGAGSLSASSIRI